MRVLLMLTLLFPAMMTPQIASDQGAKIEAQPQGSHGVRNVQFGMFLRPRDASNRDGEPVVLYPYQPWKCMAWRFESAPEGTRLVNYFTGKSFVMEGAGALVQRPASAEQRGAQSLKFVALGKGLYRIEAQGGVGVLTAVDNDGHGDLRVVVMPWKQAPAQEWQLVDPPDHFTA